MTISLKIGWNNLNDQQPSDFSTPSFYRENTIDLISNRYIYRYTYSSWTFIIYRCNCIYIPYSTNTYHLGWYIYIYICYYCWWFRNPKQPPDIYETLVNNGKNYHMNWLAGFLNHQQYHSNPSWCSTFLFDGFEISSSYQSIQQYIQIPT